MAPQNTEMLYTKMKYDPPQSNYFHQKPKKNSPSPSMMRLCFSFLLRLCLGLIAKKNIRQKYTFQTFFYTRKYYKYKNRSYTPGYTDHI